MSNTPNTPPHQIYCPVCATLVTVVHDHPETTLSACLDCGTSVSVPNRAWAKREPKESSAGLRLTMVRGLAGPRV